MLKTVYGTLLWVHYLIFLFIWIGDKELMNDNNTPWRKKKPELQAV